MRRSFHIFILLIAAILAGLVFEIATIVSAEAQVPWEVSQWTAKEMHVAQGTCQTQYDGYILESGNPTNPSIENVDGFWSYIPSHRSTEALRAGLCHQYTRDKGWEIPDRCFSFDYSDGQGEVLQRHYFCYCMRDAIVECVSGYGQDKDVLPKLSGSSTTKTRAPKQESRPMTAPEVAQAFVRAAELVREISRALRDDPYQAPRRPSGTRYVSSSSRADELYDQGMAAYAKPSHTDEETITALSSFGACIEADPHHTPCLWQLGWVFWANGDYNMTDILWRRVKQIDPSHESVDEWLGKLQRKL